MSCFIGGKSKNDECYTPKYAVTPLLKYLKRESIIWCPFDRKYSEFVRVFESAGHRVIFSHIKDGKDFFKYEPNMQYDFIISNPPFTKKRAVLERLKVLNKPYAMLMPINLLNDNYNDILDSSLELLIFDSRMEFKRNDKDSLPSRISFKCVYFCRNFLGKNIVFEKLLRDKDDEMLETCYHADFLIGKQPTLF